MTHREPNPGDPPHTASQVALGFTAEDYDQKYPPQGAGGGDGGPTYSRALDYPGLVVDAAGGLFVPGTQSVIGGPLRAATLQEQQSAFALSFPADEPADTSLTASQAGNLDLRAQELEQQAARDAQRAQEAADLLQVELQQLGEQIRQNDIGNQQWQDNYTFLQEKFAVEEAAGRRREALATETLIEQVRTRIESNNLLRQGMVQRAQQLQSQLNFQTQLANQAATAEAARINESRRQANLEQRRGVARDIAEFARAPGDVGAAASFLTAGGRSPISTGLAEGKTAITRESLLPLDLLLGTQAELEGGPRFFEAQMLQAPNVPIPQFTPQEVPDLTAFFNRLIGQAPAPALAPTTAPAPAPTTAPTTAPTVLAGQTQEDFEALAQEGAPQAETQDVINFLNASIDGGQFSTGGNTFYIDEFGALQVADTVSAQGGFFGTVTEPTVFLAGEEGAETVDIQPEDDDAFAQVDTQPLDAQPISGGDQDSVGFLNRALQLALARTPFAGVPTPVGVSAPGTSPFLQQMAAGLAALARGIPQSLFLSEAIGLAPRGIFEQPIRRTA